MIKKKSFFNNYIFILFALASLVLSLNLTSLISTAYASEASYYVDKDSVGGNCNDLNPGSFTQPFCTMTKALSAAVPGDTIYLRQGTYTPFVVRTSGNETNRITISSYDNENVIIDAAGTTQPIHLRNVSYITINNLKAINTGGYYYGGIQITGGSNNVIQNSKSYNNIHGSDNLFGIYILNSSNNTVINNETYNNSNSGIAVVANSTIPVIGNQIINNISHDNTLMTGNADGIKVEGSYANNNLIKGNVMYANGDDGLDTWSSHSNIIDGNISYNNGINGDGQGFKLGGSSTGGNNTAKFNIAYNNKASGFDSNGSPENKYYNNVSYNNGKSGFEDGWRTSGAKCYTTECFSQFINNIGYNNAVANFSAGTNTLKSNHNLWYSDSNTPKVRYNYTFYSSLAAFTQASNGLDANSISVNPGFVNATSFDFNLQSTSLAIDKGDATNPANQKICGNNVDMGAFEYCTETTPSPSPTPSPTVTSTPTSTPTSTSTPSPTQTPTPTPCTKKNRRGC